MLNNRLFIQILSSRFALCTLIVLAAVAESWPPGSGGG